MEANSSMIAEETLEDNDDNNTTMVEVDQSTFQCENSAIGKFTVKQYKDYKQFWLLRIFFHVRSIC